MRGRRFSKRLYCSHVPSLQLFNIQSYMPKMPSTVLGKLCASGGFCRSILLEFEWKSTAIEPLDDNQTPQDPQSPHLLDQLNIEIALTDRLPPFARKYHEKDTMINGGSLTDDAFQPKSFTVRIEQGNFLLPILLTNESANLSPGRGSTRQNWTKRLVFNTSPYPPESEWKETWKELWKEPEGFNYWDCKEFVADSPEVKRFVATHNKSFGRCRSAKYKYNCSCKGIFSLPLRLIISIISPRSRNFKSKSVNHYAQPCKSLDQYAHRTSLNVGPSPKIHRSRYPRPSSRRLKPHPSKSHCSGTSASRSFSRVRKTLFLMDAPAHPWR